MEEMDNTPSLQELAAEVVALRRDLQTLTGVVEENRVALQRLIHVFNERMTDVYGEIDHIKQHGPNCNVIPRQRIILRDYFTHG